MAHDGENVPQNLNFEDYEFDDEDIALGNENPLNVDSNTPAPTPTPSDTPTPTSTNKKRKSSQRAKKSFVWEVFNETIGDKNDKENYKAKCKLCGALLKCHWTQGTSHMGRHIIDHHPNWQKHASTSQATLDPTKLSQGQGSSLGVFQYSQARMRKLFVMLIVKKDLPWTFAEDEDVEEFFQKALQPLYRAVSRHTIRNDTLAMFKEWRNHLVNKFIDLKCKVSFTSDIWTGNNNNGFLCLTAHWIDDEWNIQKRILAFRHIPHPHNGLTIASTIESIIDEYCLRDKVFSIALDNASNNNSAINYLVERLNPILDGNLFHVKCACHIINLCVQDGLKHIKGQLEKIRNALVFIQSSGPRLQEFQARCTLSRVPYRRFVMDVPHRWNSTYLMIESCYSMKSVITSYYNENASEENHIVEDDWIDAQCIMDVLKVFEFATKELSSIYVPTSCVLIQQIHEMLSTISEIRTNSLKLYDFIHSLEVKFLKYWGTLPLIGSVGLVFDPRLKEVGCDWFIRDISSKMLSVDAFDVNEYGQQYKKILCDLYDIYENVHGNNTSNVAPSTSHSSGGVIGKKGLLAFMGVGTSSSDDASISMSTPKINELRAYNSRKEPISDPNLDILCWWKINGHLAPIVASMARDILAVPMSTVASEQCFSTSNRILDDRRNKLNAESLEALVCLRDWLRAEKRKQDKPIFPDDKDPSLESNVS